jgi:hypothetical protein
MTIIAYKDQGFTAVSVVTKRANGTLVTPDANPLCEIFRVDPSTGSMVKDLTMGTLGEVTLSLVPGSSFLYSAPIDLEPSLFELYELTITYSYDVAAGTNVDRITLIVSRPDTIIYRSRNITLGSQGTTFKAPTPTT